MYSNFVINFCLFKISTLIVHEFTKQNDGCDKNKSDILPPMSYVILGKWQWYLYQPDIIFSQLQLVIFMARTSAHFAFVVETFF